MAEGIIFHYRNDDNILSKMNPNAKLLSVLVFSAIVSSAGSCVVFIMSLLALMLAMAIRLPFARYLKESIFFLIIAACMVLSAAVDTHNAVLAASKGIGFLAMVLASMLLTDSTMPDDLSRSLGSALSHVVGRRAYILAAAVEITISMIPIIVDSAIGMFEARRARGASFVHHPVRTISEYSVSIVSDLLNKAEIYTDALYARGYDASARRSVPEYRALDVVVILFDIITIVIAVVVSHIL